ncbi:hypothetical protein DCAR_0830605 [Daucus carota subsp. sativus]|uniref:Uncharacterized protein n=1 Tax=Daucus carota subsp. sativus TaxID=79200 RepID=A0A175YKT6_DAUCS|nr:hypothetical protein DCAR_0830605 [Daucus carota subsp. sativus]
MMLLSFYTFLLYDVICSTILSNTCNIDLFDDSKKQPQAVDDSNQGLIMENRYIVHAFFKVPSTDIDSNDQKLEKNIKLLTKWKPGSYNKEFFFGRVH